MFQHRLHCCHIYCPSCGGNISSLHFICLREQSLYEKMLSSKINVCLIMEYYIIYTHILLVCR